MLFTVVLSKLPDYPKPRTSVVLGDPCLGHYSVISRESWSLGVSAYKIKKAQVIEMVHA